MKILVFDTETTGLPERGASITDHEKWPYIVQLSYILFDTSLNCIDKCVNEYVKIPENIEISEVSQNIHKITRDVCNSQGKPIKLLLQDFNKTLFRADLIVGHNISFDKRLMFVECFRNKVKQYFTYYSYGKKTQKPEYCTMKNTIDLCQIPKINKDNKIYYKYPTLLELYMKLFNDTPQNLHNSLVDIVLTLRCYIKVKYNVDVFDVNQQVRTLLL
tara:strand:- start:2086 stop:2736 length:651 start_codon:yes stop_codon:yes gene_type:complete